MFCSALGGAQDEIDVDFIIGEDNAAVLGALDDTRLEESRDIAVNRFHVASDAPRDFADRQRAAPAIARSSSQRFGVITFHRVRPSGR